MTQDEKELELILEFFREVTFVELHMKMIEYLATNSSKLEVMFIDNE